MTNIEINIEISLRVSEYVAKINFSPQNWRNTHHQNGWTDAAIALFNSGNIRASINKTENDNVNTKY